VKRKQALLRSNLPGIADPTKIDGSIKKTDAPVFIAIFVVIPEKTFT